MNERMVKRGIIPAALAVLCALMPVIPWFKVQIIIKSIKVSPWKIGRLLNEISYRFESKPQGIAVIVMAVLAIATLLMLVDILSAVCEFTNLDLNERFPIINIIAVGGYGLEFLLALASIILIGIIGSKSEGMIGFTAVPVLALLFSACGIVIKFLNNSFAPSHAKPAKKRSAGNVEADVRDVNATEAIGSEETMVIGKKEDHGHDRVENNTGYTGAPKPGSVEMDVRFSDFKKRYPNYTPFGKGKFAVDMRKPRNSMGDYLFAAGSYPFVVRKEFAHVGMHIEASSTPGNVIGSIRSGAVVLVAGKSGEWALCKYQGRYGWIKGKYLVQARQ